MLLNSNELVSLVHLPSSDVQALKLNRRLVRTKAAPPNALGNGIVLGQNEHAGDVKTVRLSPDQRTRHLHVIGASGTGKSTLLLNLILQDIANGDGIAVLDPHGDLIDAIVQQIPPERERDVVLLDPSDEDYPVGFNILSARTTVEKNLLSSDLVGVFRRMSTSWGDQMTAVLGNAIVAFLESSRGGTLPELRRFLVEPSFRKELLETVTDPDIVYYWTKEFPLLRGTPHGSILTRLDTFLRPKPIRYMVAQRQSRLDFANLMDGRKILLARLSHGAIGEENAHLLGALLVAKIHQVAMGRQQIREADRRFFWLYVDEFQNFVTPSMASILSGARKYRLGLILAHQELHQLSSRSPEVASAVMGNAHTRICFRVGDQDARKLEDGFSNFKAADLQNLSTGEAIARIERSDFDFNLRTVPFKSTVDVFADVRERIVTYSRTAYAVARADVERELLNARGSVAEKADVKVVTQKIAEEPNSKLEIPPPSVPKPKQAKRESPPPDIKELIKEPPSPGRGGREHKYLQNLIKQWAEGMGYRATIEEQVLGNCGVDVALTKGEISIACEISVTTDHAQELSNVKKCLDGGYRHVVLISNDEKRLAKLKERIEGKIPEGKRSQVQFLLPAELFTFVQQLEVESLNSERTVNGYKVKTSFVPLDPQAQKDRQQALSEIVAKAIKRLQKRSK